MATVTEYGIHVKTASGLVEVLKPGIDRRVTALEEEVEDLDTAVANAQSAADAADANSGVTAGTYGPTANATPAYGATFNVPAFTVNAKGKLTQAYTRTVKMPAAVKVNGIAADASGNIDISTSSLITDIYSSLESAHSTANSALSASQTASHTAEGWSIGYTEDITLPGYGTWLWFTKSRSSGDNISFGISAGGSRIYNNYEYQATAVAVRVG